MAKEKLDSLQWELIVDRLQEERCVPFLGAGVNIRNDERGYPGLLLGADVANRLAKKVRRDGELARIALEYEVRTDREYLIRFLEEALPDANLEPSPALKVLARLPFKLAITTNYDRLLERALGKRRFTCLVQPASGFEDTKKIRNRLASLERYPGAIVYKIHGTFQLDRKPWLDVERSVTITEDDYVEFLTTHDSESVKLGVPKLIKTLVTPSTLLFLGYSLQDWDFRTIYRGLVGRLNKHEARKSFAIQHKPPRFWVDYWKDKGVQIVDMDIYDFCDELEKKYFAQYPAKS